jgi:hypothetical protein
MQEESKKIETEKSFFLLQMESIGIDATNNFFEVPKRIGLKPNPNGNFSEWEAMELDETTEEVERNLLFTEDEAGNMVIPYYDLYGHLRTDHQGDAKWPKPFHRTRFKVPRLNAEGKEMKYQTAWKAGNQIYFTPEVILKFRQKAKIELLVITEGEKKAIRGSKMGLDVVGIAGIHNFYTNNDTKRIHEDLIWLMVVCKVEKVLFLTDADTLTVKFEPGKDLSKRPNLFYTAWKNFREAVMAEMSIRKDLALRDVYVGCISRNHVQDGKGLDDLLTPKLPNRHPSVLESLKMLQLDNLNFNILNITDGNHKLQNFLGVISAENFYQVYEADIKDNEFVFKRLSYRWVQDGDNGKLLRIGHQDVKEYMRIGCDYFRLVKVPNKHNELEEEIVKWSKGEITQDYGKYFMDDLPKYLTWCNMPDNSPSYQRIHNSCFNLYNPVIHKPAKGGIENTLSFLKHIFEGNGTAENDIEGDIFTVALDYLTLMWQNPTHILPVLCLVSPENETGKSSFLKWLQDIFGSNATIIDNERFKQSFNSHYITKYIIGIDEGFLDVEKRAEKERLKKLATDDKQFLEFKGADVKTVDFYAKLIICSNDADSLMKIEDGEVRWFVVRVKTFAEHGIKNDPDMRNKMKAEIPAWLHFLSTRKVFHARKTRSWFATEHIITEQLKSIIEATRNRVDRVVDGVITDIFQTYKVNSFRMDVATIVQVIKRDAESKYAIDQLEVKKFLKDKMKMVPSEPQRLRYPESFNAETGEIQWNISKVGRCFHFKVEEWIKGFEEDKYSEHGQRANMGEPLKVEPTQPATVPPKPNNDDLPF